MALLVDEVGCDERSGECRPEVAAEPASEAPAEKPAAPRVRSNPFGAARPREEVLKEKATSQTSTPPPEGEEAKEQPAQGVKVELDTVDDSQPKTSEASNEAAAPQPEASTTEESRQAFWTPKSISRLQKHQDLSKY